MGALQLIRPDEARPVGLVHPPRPAILHPMLSTSKMITARLYCLLVPSLNPLPWKKNRLNIEWFIVPAILVYEIWMGRPTPAHPYSISFELRIFYY